MRSLVRPVLVAVGLLAASAPLVAKSVFLNGVNIDGVANQTFENCTVEIDAQGNIHIKAKGYQVQTQGTPTTPQPVGGGTGMLTRRYWIVTEKNFPGMTQYDIDVFINSVWVRRLSGDEEQVVFEVTKYVKSGNNVIHFTASKNMGATRKSHSPHHYFKVIVGEGNVGGDNVMIDNPLLEYKRTAAESRTFNDNFTFVGR
ncbi:MAG: hypothetical protein JXR83_09665 [Deltaproteobacteria bacterium]|nr:hypothetical protein [Deltaproteobacteria bacterium]